MKNLYFIVLGTALLCGSCKKDNSTNNSTGGTVYVPSATAMSAKMDGSPFVYNGLASSSSSGLSTLYLSNTDVNATLSLTVENNTPPAAYTIGNTSFPGISYYDNGTYYQGASGTITVTSNDTVHQVMKGNFSAVVTNSSSGQSHSITEGSFVLNYQ